MKRQQNKLPLSPFKLCVSALIHATFETQTKGLRNEGSQGGVACSEAVLLYIVQLVTNSNESNAAIGIGNGYSAITETLIGMDFGDCESGTQEAFLKRFESITTNLGEADRLFRFIQNTRTMLDFGVISTTQDKPIVNIYAQMYNQQIQLKKTF